VSRLRPLSESECYTRLYGERDATVAVIREQSAQERPSGGLLGDETRRLIEERYGLREPDGLPGVEAA
jgi:hypothetical protein